MKGLANGCLEGKALNKNHEIKLKYDSYKVVLDHLDSIFMSKFSFGSYYSEVEGGLKSLLMAMDITLPSKENEKSDILIR